MIMGPLVSWDAYGENNKYHFRYCSKIDEDGTAAAERFFQKITRGVQNKTIDSGGERLKLKGTVNIVERKTRRGYDPGFEIDGRIYTPNEFADMLSSYMGFSMRYQIHDMSDDLLQEDEYLYPVKITRETILDELQTAIAAYGRNRFRTEEENDCLNKAITSSIDKLEFLTRSFSRDDALKTGKDMMKLLDVIFTWDDTFLKSYYDRIRNIIDPFRTDEDLWET